MKIIQYYSDPNSILFIRVLIWDEDRHLDQQQAKKIVHRGVHEATNEKGHDHAHESRLYESLRIHALEADPVEVVDDFLRVHSNKLRNVRPGLLTLNPLILIKNTNE